FAKVHQDDRDRMRMNWARAVAVGEVYESEMRIWHVRSQSYRHCVVRAVPLRHADGTVREWIGTITDIDDRKRAEEQFRLAVDAAPNAMVMVDQTGHIVMANRQLETLVGYTRDDVIG